MKLNINFSELIKLRESIGASLATISKIREPEIRTTNPFEIQILERGEVTLSGQELDEQLKEIGGLLAIGNTQITLHIEEPWEDEESLSQIPASDPKYHVSDCKTLENMRAGGRFNRYVTSNKEDGYFTVVPYDRINRKRTEKMRANLLPCRNCLSKLNYKDYNDSSKVEKNRIVSELDISVFFSEFKTTFRSLPLYSEDTYPAGGYPDNWSEITNRKRAQNNWKCSCCNVNLSKYRQYLHTHHNDGVGGNVRDSNLQVLCLLCHAEQPFHAHMRVTSAEKLQIRNLRQEQNLRQDCTKCKS